MAFLRRHYAIVGLKEVLDAQARIKPLPRRAVLITFDDGWYDNLAHALPALAGTPWTLFAAANALLEPDCWWQETLLWTMRSGGVQLSARCGDAAERRRGIEHNAGRGEMEYIRFCCAMPDSLPTKEPAALAPYEDKLRRNYAAVQ